MSQTRPPPSAFVTWSGNETDRAYVDWLERALRRYRVPSRLQREHQLPSRAGRIQVDRETQANVLDEDAQRRLRASDFLIVVCSPLAREHPRVQSIIQSFRALGRDDQIVALLVDGEPAQSFPPALTRAVRIVRDEAGAEREVVEPVEPLAADIRPIRSERVSDLRRLARLRLMACLLNVRFDDLRRRELERKARLRRIALATLAASIVVFTALGIWAVRSKKEAQNRAVVAAANTKQAVAARAKESEALGVATAAKQTADEATAREREARRAHEQARDEADAARAAAAQAKAAAQLQEAQATQAAAHAREAATLADRRALQAGQAKASEDAARETAEARARQALAARIELLSELGRQALVSDRIEQAVAYLGDAYSAASPSPALQVLMAEALRRAPPRAQGLSTVPRDAAAIPPGERVVPGGVAWLQEGARLLVVQGDGRVRTLDPTTGVTFAELAKRAPQASPVQRALVLPRHDRLFLVHRDGHLRVLTLAGAEVGSIPGVMRNAQWLVADTSGATIVLAGDDGLSAWTWAVDAAPVRLHERGGVFLDLAVRPGGRSVAVCQTGASALWDTANGKQIRSLATSAGGEALRVAWSPSGDALAVSSRQDTEIQGVAATGAPLRPVLPRGAWRAGFFSSEDDLFLWDDTTRGRVRWSLDTRKTTRRARAPLPITRELVPSPGGSRALTRGFSGMVEIWDTRSLGLLATLDHGARRVDDAGFSPGADRIYTLDDRGQLHLWHVPLGSAPTAISMHTTDEGISFAQFSPDDRFVLEQSGNKTASVFDVRDGSIRHQLTGPKRTPSVGCYSGDGARIAVATQDGSVDVFAADTGQRIRTFEGADVVVLDRTGRRLLACPAGRASIVWDVDSGRRLATLEGSRMLFAKLAAFHPTKDWVLAGGLSGASIWDASTGRRRFVLQGDAVPKTEEARFSPDGRRVVCWSRSTKEAVVWDAESGKVVHVLRGHEQGLWDACFDAAGERVLTASADWSARVWSVRDGALLSVLHGHEDWVMSCAFHPSGHLVATGGADASVRVWDAARGDPLFVHAKQGQWVRDVAFDAAGERLLVSVRNGVTVLFDVRTEVRAPDVLQPELLRRSRFRLKDERLVAPAR